MVTGALFTFEWKEAVGRKHHFLLCIGKFTGFYMPSNSFLLNRVHELTGENGTVIVSIFKYVLRISEQGFKPILFLGSMASQSL